MVKRCCYGTCNSDTRYPERLSDGVSFIPFPKPASNLEKCKRWIKLCGRPHQQLNLEILKDRRKAKHIYVCTKHFHDGKPTNENPDPQPACAYDTVTPVRPPPKCRSFTEPPNKKARTALMETFRQDGNELTVYPVARACTDDSMYNAELEISERPETIAQGAEMQFETNTDENRLLDVLALAAENQSLKQQIAKLILENEKHLRMAAIYKQSDQENQTGNKRLFSVEKLKENKKKDEFIYYTGLNKDQFSALYQFLVPVKEPFKMTVKISSFEQMHMEDQLLMVLMKLRQNFDFLHLGRLFGLTQQDASTIFSNWIQFMFYRCGSVSIWPHRDIIISMMPDKFREEFPNTVVIIDGTEIKIQRPSSMTRQSQCYSDYKSCNTLKGLVGIDPRGSVILASMLFSGSISDKELTVQSGFLDLLEKLKECGKIKEGDAIMVDKGFRIKDEIENLGLNLNIPPFAHTGSKMSSADINLTEKIARHRVHVERAIARIKNFKILSHRIDLSMFRCINQVWFVCCFLTNFMGFLIK